MVNEHRITVNGDAIVFKSDKSNCCFQIVFSCHSRVCLPQAGAGMTQ
ncbi:MAG: hypothetical protein HYZ34_09410 [Ignavibacteriae bacterium]|nr:hypothetical protein [Ignavibacteriota bacterium]